MLPSLPTKLKNEPLIDAIFEVRFSGEIPASVVLPGVFFSNLTGEKKIEHLPIAQIPKLMRDADPNLKFAAISRIDWTDFFINIGDFSVSISCKYPYPGWSNFRQAIIQIIDILNGAKIVRSIDRYSLKYVDLFPATDDQQKISLLTVKMSIAGHELMREPFQIRIEIPKDGLVHAVHLVSSATAVLHNGVKKEGLVVDVDTHASLNGASIQSLLDHFPDKLDSIHAANKAMFFDCLRSETIASLEPSYE
jgi:uncharacterized protein (TIGR04255 family)